MPHKRSWSSWLPVILWLCVIAVESTDLGSGAHTGRLLGYLWSRILGPPDPVLLETVNHVLRKTGHVVGYAILSWLIFRAVRNAWRNRQDAVHAGLEYFWQMRWAVAAVFGTLLAAGADEIHQSLNPARTGTWHDVVLDTTAAIALQLMIFLLLRRRSVDRAYTTS